MGFFNNISHVQLMNQNSTQSRVAAMVQVLTQRLLKIWAPTYSPEGRSNAIAVTVGEKVSKADRPPVVGVGHSLRGGTDTLELATDVESDDLDLDLLRKAANVGDIPVHVVETGEWLAASSPAQGGDSIGYPDGPTGTVTCLVKNKDGQQFLLSCNHVIAALNQGNRDADNLWYPGKADGGGPGSVIGKLHDFKAIDFSVEKGNVCDVALCTPSGQVAAGIRKLGAISGIWDDPPLELPVRKYGRSTKETQGALFTKNSSVLITYADKRRALFEKQLQIVGTGHGDFAQEGDSGALIVDMQNKAVGLLFSVATKQNAALANPIKSVLADLDVTPV